MTTTLQKGDRVRIVADVEAYPVIYLKGEAGETGTVTDFENGPLERRLHVLLDTYHEDLEEWQNVLQIYEDRDVEMKNPPIESYVTIIPLTIADLATMAKNGKPIDDEEWGGERQILAQNMVPIAMERAGFVFTDEHDSWCLKATVDEIMDANVRWFREWQAHAIARKWVARLGLGFHPDTRGDDYTPQLSQAERREYDADMESLFAIADDPYACGLKAMADAGLIP